MKQKIKGLFPIKRIIALGIIAIILLCVPKSHMSDKEIRSKVVQLEGNGYACSGEQIRTAAGNDYILTAGHCAVLGDPQGNMIAITEDETKYAVQIVAEDPNSDLLLLSPIPDLVGLPLAHISKRFEHIRTFTHGERLKTYKTEGTIIDKKMIDIPAFQINSQESFVKCLLPKYQMQADIFNGMICILHIDELYTTAQITHGSSGGLVINDNDEVVAVVSAHDGEGGFGLMVDQREINQFINYFEAARKFNLDDK